MKFPGTKFPGDEIPWTKFPGDEIPGDEIPGTKFPGDEISGDEIPWTKFPGDEISGDEISRGRNFRDETSVNPEINCFIVHTAPQEIKIFQTRANLSHPRTPEKWL